MPTLSKLMIYLKEKKMSYKPLPTHPPHHHHQKTNSLHKYTICAPGWTRHGQGILEKVDWLILPGELEKILREGVACQPALEK